MYTVVEIEGFRWPPVNFAAIMIAMKMPAHVAKGLPFERAMDKLKRI